LSDVAANIVGAARAVVVRKERRCMMDLLSVLKFNISQIYHMRLRLLFVMVLLGAMSFTNAQKKAVLIQTLDKGSYFYIPSSALADSTDGIIFQEKRFTKATKAQHQIQLTWTSMCTDGYYNIDITPQQIFFHSSHDNPNPNYLFWVMDIDSTQYAFIKKGLKQKPPRGFENQSKYYKSYMLYWDVKFKDTMQIPDEWTSEQEKLFDTYCDASRKSQLKKIFSVLNKYLPQGKKLQPPSDETINLIKPKAFASSRKEVLEYLPTRFTPPSSQPATLSAFYHW